MLRIQKYLIIATAFLVSVGIVGCGGGTTPPAGAKPAYCVSIEQLAAKLGLSVQKAGTPYYELTNANNRVLLFLNDSGRVYVNGRAVGSVGTVRQVGGSYYISELMVPKIRGYLATSYNPPGQTGPSPKIPGALTGLVVIDPGHGGRDPGATSYLGYYEKDINLNIGRKVASYLQQQGIKTVMTRNSDTFIELNDRADVANRVGADLFVAIHADSNGDRLHRGYTVYVSRSASWASKKTGQNIESSMANTGMSSKGMRNADYRVLVRTKCPAVLVECGYLSNPSEAALLYDSQFQDRIARAIADGIVRSL
ncbi:MAG: N-acetylmuramoyl-L-alanine amidase [Planctomycetales bacterium]|nr:N-acetylmuramoyl-L-alanine amidase [Planctomycetales bacterium]